MDELLDDTPRSTFDDSDADPDFIPDRSKRRRLNILNSPRTAISASGESNILSPREVPEKPRKKKSKPETWKRVIKKTLRESGKEYTDSKGNIHQERKVKEITCENSCPYKCNTLFSRDERVLLHTTFWKLTDIEKNHYYSKYVTRSRPKRKRTAKAISRKNFSYQYHFELNNSRISVCQTFFLRTLDISKQRIYYFFKTVYNDAEGIPRKPLKGKYIKRVTSIEKTNTVKEHIQKFPVVDAHYCRANSSKQYLEPGLSIRKLYKLYLEESEDPVTFCVYSKIFNENFNLSFFKPKKDMCDTCVKFENLDTPSAQEKQCYSEHRAQNDTSKIERDTDRKISDQDIVVICYDLQNVFALPKANTSSFFYRRKFQVYNLTGYCQNNKITYCSLWGEHLSGRTGNDIASALIAILKKTLMDFPNTKHFILWSDSCIPQNRNRITSLALLKFLKDYPQIQTITQKFSETGHSQVQELDAVHSTIYGHLKNLEVHGPISLIKLLNSMNYNKVKLKIIQLNKDNFLNYNKASMGLKFLPYQKAKQILYDSKDIFEIKYKVKHSEPNFNCVKICSSTRSENQSTLFKIENCRIFPDISKQKQDDIRFMLPFLNKADREFYEVVVLKKKK